ncbi:coiled-coil domain-containing protein 87 [Calypte anna]|uniref:coiled-coil domain-containing protein 87 n=1 Tax=Calypte anna TaxID=9244 RepID=UPI0011C43097|nr:coiled-coil domain-containing protein 87 [Calypte anna]
MHRSCQLPGGAGVLLPPCCFSLVIPDHEIPLVMAGARQHAAGEGRSTRHHRLQLAGNCPAMPCREVPLFSHPVPQYGTAKPPTGASAMGLTLRPYPALCWDAYEDVEQEPSELLELYQELSPELHTEGLQFPPDTLLEPAAPTADLLPLGHQNARVQPSPWQQQSLFADYLQYVAATSSDFLGAIFHLNTNTEKPVLEHHQEPALAPRPEAAPAPKPAPAPAEPYERGLWKPVIPQPVPMGLQQRLHRLWMALRVPVWDQLAMAVKYSTGTAWQQLPAALEVWEVATSDILQREHLLAQLERLEEGGSDPSRLFRTGTVLAQRRTIEASSRQRLWAALANVEARLRVTLRQLQEGYGDTVTLQGRPYAPHARRDIVEMLYWLQQCRRAEALRGALRRPWDLCCTPQPIPMP